MATTKRQNRLQTLTAELAELRRTLQFKDAILGQVAHDLRASIGNVMDLTQLLLADEADLNGEQRATLQDIFQAAASGESLLNDLLVACQSTAGRLPVYPEEFRFHRAILEIVRPQQLRANRKRTKIVIEPTTGEEVSGDWVFADPNRFRQIMDNLISNAVKYSPPASTIFIRSRQTLKNWTFWVQDLGPGISEADRKQLFNPFTKLSARPTARENSVGLGLSIVRQLVEAHGGTISVKNAPGRGALFWFTLPRKPRPADKP